MVKKLIELLPENEEAIATLRKVHPNLNSDVGAIRFALAYATLHESNSEDGVDKILQKLGELSHTQDVSNILLVSMMEGIKVSVLDRGDPLDSSNIKLANRSRERHLAKKERDLRHGGARDGNSSPHDQA
jgi:hypothetical protein